MLCVADAFLALIILDALSDADSMLGGCGNAIGEETCDLGVIILDAPIPAAAPPSPNKSAVVVATAILSNSRYPEQVVIL